MWTLLPHRILGACSCGNACIIMLCNTVSTPTGASCRLSTFQASNNKYTHVLGYASCGPLLDGSVVSVRVRVGVSIRIRIRIGILWDAVPLYTRL